MEHSNASFLPSLLLFLGAAVIAVPIFKRIGFGAILGYLIAGLAIGPSGFALFTDTVTIQHIGEIGIVLLLFVIGLELQLSRLLAMRKDIFGLGGLQLVVCALVIGGIAHALGLSVMGAALTGIALALSATAIALQVLGERGELQAPYGQRSFAVLLFQDMSVVPILALIPLFAVEAAHAASDGGGWTRTGIMIGSIAVVVLAGRYLLNPLFRILATTDAREVMTAAALLLVLGTALLMQWAGMSMALGAFLAGVLLADSEYRHEIEAQIEPFRGLLLGLFFIGVGMSLDVKMALAEPQLVGLLLLGLIVAKALVLYVVSRVTAREDNAQSVALAALLAQGGEFAFVVFGLAATNGLLSGEQKDLAILVITLSMAATPLLVRLRTEFAPIGKPKPVREFDALDIATPRVIVAGMGRFGQIVARMLNANRIPFTALEADPEQVDFMRHFGNTVFYGDASRLDLLRAAQADKAEIFVIATGDPDANLRTARLLKRHFPHLKVFARARNRQHVFKLMDLNVDSIVRETFFSSLEIARGVFEALGYDKATAVDYVQRFRKHDERMLALQYPVYDDEAALLQSAKESRADLERLFQADSGQVEDA